MLPVSDDRAALRGAVLRALEFSDADWYRYTLKKDLCGCTLSDAEERTVVDGAARTASDMARLLSSQYGALPAQELAQSLHLSVVHTIEEVREPFLYLGLYDPPTRTIALNDSVILLVQQFIAENGLDDITPAADIQRIALFHEIFHAMEEETPGIYTRSHMLERKVLGIFPYMRGLDGACEVGAVHFSKHMAAISYSPCIYERYLLLALGQLSIDFLPPNV